MEHIHLEIDGMSCGHCVASVEKTLTGIDGVRTEGVRVGGAELGFDPIRTSTTAILAAVSDAGFPARLGTH